MGKEHGYWDVSVWISLWVDVTDIPDTVFMDEVVLIGRDGDDEITGGGT